MSQEEDIPEPPKRWESDLTDLRKYGWILSAVFLFFGIVIFLSVRYSDSSDIIFGLVLPVTFIALGAVLLGFMIKTESSPGDMWKRKLPYDRELYRELDEKIQSELKGHSLSWVDYDSNFLDSSGMIEIERVEGTEKELHQKFRESLLNKEDLELEYGMFVLFPNNRDNRKELFFVGINNIRPENSSEAMDMAEQIESMIDEIKNGSR